MSAPSEQPRGVVTGAGGGIGKAVLHRLLREGARVLAVDAKAGVSRNSTARTAKRLSPT
jgi:NAD(P)-dependent dehydrogenase (short-subunit alcohol dehydrogenase family)